MVPQLIPPGNPPHVIGDTAGPTLRSTTTFPPRARRYFGLDAGGPASATQEGTKKFSELTWVVARTPLDRRYVSGKTGKFAGKVSE